MVEASSQAKLRRYRDTLATSGIAIIIFGVWDIAKSMLTTVYGSNLSVENEDVVAELETSLASMGDDAEIVIVLFALVAMLVVLLGLAMRLYVGLSARAEARGKRKSWAYVIIAGLMATTSALLMAVGLALSGSLANIASGIVTSLIELSSLLAYVDLIRSAVKVKRLVRNLPEG